MPSSLKSLTPSPPQPANSLNHLVNTAGPSRAYDAAGNMTKDHNGGTLVWDGWNRLLSVRNSSGTLIAAYSYDGAGRLITQTNAGGGGTVQTDLYFSGTQDIETRTGVTTASNGTVSADNVFSPVYVNALLTRDTGGFGGTRVYFTSDANQDITGVVSTAGTMLQHQVYDAYGKVTLTNGSWTMTGSDSYSLVHLWQGGFRDAATGLYLFEHRWYSVDVQWLSEDPAGYIDGTSLYPAIAANPINGLDPSGLKKYVYLFEGFGGYNANAEKNVRDGKPFPAKGMNGNFSYPFAVAQIGATLRGLTDVEWEYHSDAVNIGELADQAAMDAKVNRAGATTSPATTSAPSTTSAPAPCYDQIISIGYSRGGDTAIQFAEELGKRGIKVSLGVSVDPVPLSPFDPNYSKPKNADVWLNYYQTFAGSLGILGHPLKGADNKQQDMTAEVKREMSKQHDLTLPLPPSYGGHLFMTDSPEITKGIEDAINKLSATRLA